MSYDPEKYREKREKVLGIRKRSVSFAMIALAVSVIILSGLGAVTLPQVYSYMATRHLDDAIFKLESSEAWPDGLMEQIQEVHGVIQTQKDHGQTRLVITFDRRHDALKKVTSLFAGHGLNVTLLNRLNHRQHLATLEKEEKELEIP